MLNNLHYLLGEKRKRLYLPIGLMMLDTAGSVVINVMLYLSVMLLLLGVLTPGYVAVFSVIIFVVVLARLAVYRKGSYLNFSEGARICADMRLDLANHYRALSLSFFNEKSSGYLLDTLTRDLNLFELIMTHSLPALTKTLASVVLITVVTFFIHWQLALAQLIVLAVAFPLLLWSNRIVLKYGRKKRQLVNQMISTMLEYIRGIEVFKSFNMTGEHFCRMKDSLEKNRQTNIRAETRLAVASAAYFIVVRFLLPLVLFGGAYLLAGKHITPPQLAAFLFMSIVLSALLISFQHEYNMMKDLQLAADNLEKVYRTPTQTYQEENVEFKHHDIRFENVSFAYRADTPVLRNLDFHAKAGTVTALIGPSGSGKTTVANLIARFMDVDQGRILIGGQDIKTLKPDALLQHISAVFQENRLLSDTIYNNILVGRRDASREEVLAAARNASVHDFVTGLPEGYDTLLAEGGANLSVGEKQRIAIARALLKDAPILLLDESTASLDADNEAKINCALDRLMQGKTVIVIAHRLNTIKQADHIILLNRGRIEEAGTHEKLMHKQGHYYQMIQAREKALHWQVAVGNE